MTDTEMIAMQAKKIACLEVRASAYKKAFEEIRIKLICIGGPLNDNFLKYTPEQLKVFFQIDEIISDVSGVV